MKKRNQIKFNINPLEVRAHFVLRGTTLQMWAKNRGYSVTTVFRAVKNERHGKISRKIVRELQNETKS